MFPQSLTSILYSPCKRTRNLFTLLFLMTFVDSPHLLSTLDFSTLDSRFFYSRLFTLDSRLLLSTLNFTVAHHCHVKSKTLASKAKRSRQKQNARVKSKTIASKANYTGLKSKTIASKAKSWRQKRNGRVKSKTVASKAKCIRALVAIDEQKHSENLLIVKLLLRH